MRPFDLYNPNPLIEALLIYKGVEYKKCEGPPPAFPDTKDPVLRDNYRWIVGVYPLLGYLDRRISWPAFFPTDADDFAKASMVFDLFQKERPKPQDWVPIIRKQGFVLGAEPCVIDLMLSQIEYPDELWASYRNRIDQILTQRHRYG